MSNGLLFDRKWRLQVGSFQTDSLRVSFDIEKTRNYLPNGATISVWNLSRPTRDQFDKGAPVSVFGGFASGVDLLFAGQLYEPTTQRDGPDWITTLRCRDGNTAWTRNVNQSFGAGVPILTVLQAVVGSMGLVIPPATRATLAGRVTRGPIVQSGYAYKALQEVLTSEGLSWSIQDNALQVLAQDAATSEQAIVLAPDTGLIGSPERTDTNGGSGSKRVQVVATSLLQGGL